MTDYNRSAVVALLFFLAAQWQGKSYWHGQSNHLQYEQAWTGRLPLASTLPLRWHVRKWQHRSHACSSLSLCSFEDAVETTMRPSYAMGCVSTRISLIIGQGLNNIYLRYKGNPWYSGTFCSITPALHRLMSCCSRLRDDHSPLNWNVCSSTCNSVDSNFLFTWFSFSLFSPSEVKVPWRTPQMWSMLRRRLPKPDPGWTNWPALSPIR